MKKQTSKKKMMKTNCYALGYRVFKFYFQFTHFSNVRIFVINEELACRSHKDDDTHTYTQRRTHTRTQDIHTSTHTLQIAADVDSTTKYDIRHFQYLRTFVLFFVNHHLAFPASRFFVHVTRFFREREI